MKKLKDFWVKYDFWVMYPFACAAAFAITYGFALLGEPRSLWVMRLLGLLS
jgi:hypothetical protein